MKAIATIITALALFSTFASAATPTDTTAGTTTGAASVPAGAGHIYVVNGTVIVTRGKDPEHRVINSEPIVSDTLISTGDKSAALLKFEDGQVVTMQANSTFHVREYRYDVKHVENSNILFSILKGGMRFITGLVGQSNKQAFKLVTPNATIGIRGTEFMVAMVDNNIYSQVLTGNIELTNSAGTTVLNAGQSAVVSTTSSLASLLSAAAVPSGTFTELLSIPVEPSAIPASGSSAAPATSLHEADGRANGAGEKASDTNSKAGVGVTGKVGSLGAGAELSFGRSDYFSARIGLNAFTYNYNHTSSTVNYDFKLQLQTISALADWYPFAGRFRTSAGLMYDNNKATLGGNPTGGTYTLNGTTYSAAQVASLQGTMAFNKVAPYLGIGWGNPVSKNKGWGLVSDVGVMFQGKPTTTLTATCAAAIATSPTCTQLQADTAAENAKLQDDVKNFRWWPVVSVGISYQW